MIPFVNGGSYKDRLFISFKQSQSSVAIALVQKATHQRFWVYGETQGVSMLRSTLLKVSKDSSVYRSEYKTTS